MTEKVRKEDRQKNTLAVSTGETQKKNNTKNPQEKETATETQKK